MIREVSTTSGAGNLVVNGATAGFQSLAQAFGADAPGLLLRLLTPAGAWEVGRYDYVHATRTIDRSAGFITSSTGAKVDFAGEDIVVEPVVPPHAGEHDAEYAPIGPYLKLDASNDPVTGDLEINAKLGVGRAPAEELDVVGDVRIKGKLANARILFLTNDESQQWNFQNTQSGGAFLIRDATAGTNPLSVAAGAATNALSIQSDGDVEAGFNLNAAGALTEAGFRAIAVDTDGSFKIAVYSSTTPRGFSRVTTGVDGACIRLAHTGGGTADVGASRKDVGADFATEGHALTEAELAAHTHDVKYSPVAAYAAGATSGVRTLGGATVAATESAGSGNAHTHVVKLKYAEFGLYAFEGA